jgi:Phycobilisome degradation protein nblA
VDILALELSLEQQFSLAKYAQQVQELSPDRTQKFLIEAFRQLMVKDNVIRVLAKSGSLN